MQLYETQRFSYKINKYGQISHFTGKKKSGLFLELEACKNAGRIKGKKNKYWLERLGSEEDGW